jgi:phosphoserine phosphatase
LSVSLCVFRAAYWIQDRYFVGVVHLLGKYLQKRIGIDYVHANELEIIDGKLTGKYLAILLTVQRKLSTWKPFRKQPYQETIAVGDGANDLPMLNLAGLGIAFHAKQRWKKTLRRFPVLVWMGFCTFWISRHIDMMEELHKS